MDLMHQVFGDDNGGDIRDAYERRDRVGVIAFRGSAAELLLPPTDSIESAEQAMRSLAGRDRNRTNEGHAHGEVDYRGDE
jgi:hypothetical protein